METPRTSCPREVFLQKSRVNGNDPTSQVTVSPNSESFESGLLETVYHWIVGDMLWTVNRYFSTWINRPKNIFKKRTEVKHFSLNPKALSARRWGSLGRFGSLKFKIAMPIPRDPGSPSENGSGT